MAEKEREPIGWFTSNGARIPIYDGQTRDEAFKEFQIKANKAEADERNNQPEFVGKHTVYRAGDLSGGGTGLIYFATNKETADEYGKKYSFKFSGQTIKVPKRETFEYEVKVKNPLIVESDDDIHCAMKVFNQFYNKQDDFKKFPGIGEYAEKHGGKITGINALQIWYDKANGAALKNSKYDAIIYKTYNFEQRKRTYSQLLLPVGSKAIKKKGN